MKFASPTVYLQERYFMCSDAHIYNPRLALPEAEEIVIRHLSSPWDEAVCAHMRCIWAMRRRDFEEAYACQVVVVNYASHSVKLVCGDKILRRLLLYRYDKSRKVSKLLTELKEENWILPVVLIAAIDLRRFAHGIDMSVAASNSISSRSHGRQMETAAQLILRLFQLCASDSRTQLEDSKKLGMMGLANQLFKIYFQGVFPHPSLLEKYNLTEFLGIAEAVKCHIMKTHLLPIEVFTDALKLMGVEDIDQDETECILANLIYEGKIKGYLAHQQQKLVVSKLQAFPTLTNTPTSSTSVAVR